MFKVGDLVRVRNDLEFEFWYVNVDNPDVTVGPHDTGVVTRENEYHADAWVVRWFRTGGETGMWGADEIELVENEDVQAVERDEEAQDHVPEG